VDLAGEATVRVEGELQSVSEDGRVIENPADPDEGDDFAPGHAPDGGGTDLCLDLRYPDITCDACGGPPDCSYNEEW
jgi:hypothetical protein